MGAVKQYPTKHPTTAAPLRAGGAVRAEAAATTRGNGALSVLFRATKEEEPCPKCAGKLHRRAGPGRDPGAAPLIVYEVLRSPGRPLDDGVRADMEERFGGADF